MNSQKQTLWITRTGLLLALVLAAQFLGKLIPGGAALLGPLSLTQLVTGSLVNLLLVLAAAVTGTLSGVVIGVLSALLATLLGVGPPFPQISPVIAVANALLVLFAGLFFRLGQKRGGRALTACGLVLAAAVKCAFLWLTVPFALSLIPEIKEAQLKALSLMFSWPQFVTAVAGSLLALLVLPSLRRALFNEKL